MWCCDLVHKKGDSENAVGRELNDELKKKHITFYKPISNNFLIPQKIIIMFYEIRCLKITPIVMNLIINTRH